MGGQSLERKSLQELLSYKFNIPEFQRGYRWQNSEIDKLINDILGNKGEPYFLQVLVLKRKEDSEEYDIVDGQQRLTTLAILLSEMKVSLSENLKHALLEDGRRDSDKKFIDDAKLCCNNKLCCNDKLCAKIVLKSFFLVYELSQEDDEEEVFQRLNTGKIPLSSAELVRARDISKCASENKKDRSSLWQDMEMLLQDDGFYNFLCRDANCHRYDASRIDYVLELFFFIFILKELDFNDFEKKLEENPLFIIDLVDKNEVDFSFDDFHSFVRDFLYNYCYSDYHSRNYVGYRIYSTAGSKVFIELKSIYNKYTTQARLELRELNPALDKNWKNKEKGSDDNDIKILLLYYIVARYDNASLAFSFHEFFKEGFDIEHIHALNQREYTDDALKEIISKFNIKQSKSDLENPILKALFGYPETKQYLIDWFYEKQGFSVTMDSLGALVIELMKTIYKEGLENIDEKFVPKYVSLDDVKWINSLGNLVLLSTHVNRSFGNDLFPMKCKTMKKKIEEGHFIPFCVSEKYDENLLEWDEAAKDCYMNELESIFGGDTK